MTLPHSPLKRGCPTGKARRGRHVRKGLPDCGAQGEAGDGAPATAEEIVRSGEIRGRSARPPDPLSAISQHRLDPRFNFTEVIGVLWNR